MDNTKKSFFCIGSLNWDQYQLTEGKVQYFLGGSACNTAYFLADLLPENEYGVYMVGLVGDDDAGQNILNQLYMKKIILSLVKQEKGTSGKTTIYLDGACERKIERYQSVGDELATYLSESQIQKIIKDNLIHIKSNRVVINAILKITDHIFSIDISGFLGKGGVDLAEWIDQKFINKSIEILLGNEEEFRILLQALFLSELPANFDNNYKFSKRDEKLFHKLMKKFHAKIIGLKCGKHGSILITEKIYLEKRAPKITVIDTTGAGDAYNAAFIANYLLNNPYEKILANAIKLGSANCTILGAQELKIEKNDYL